jgi:FAD/FMN-containing dehydrogenase
LLTIQGVSLTGGWFQGGGHNPFANKFGLQVDNVVEVEVVTADGKFHKVSECNNPELFWAIRGGGGSTFGVVTAVTVKVFPTFPVAVSRFFVNSTSKEGISRASAYFLQKGAELRDKYGLQGYFYIYPNSFQSVLHMPDKFAHHQNAKDVTEPLMRKMEELAGSKNHIEPRYFFYKNYKDWYTGEMGDEEQEDMGGKFESFFDGSDGSAPSMVQVMMNPLLVIPWYVKNPQYPEKRKRDVALEEVEEHPQLKGLSSADPKIMRSQPIPRHYLDSRLLSNEHVNSVSLHTLAKAVHATMPEVDGAHYRGFLYGGGRQAAIDPDSVGVTPAWRNATYHFIINAVPGDVRHDYSIAPIAKLFPDAGAYVNEASVYEPDWKQVFWGSHYHRLEKIKNKYDPEHIFWCTPCVGADYFTYDDERICKSSEYPVQGMAPQTLPNPATKVGISSLPGEVGIPHPYIGVIENWALNNILPASMPKSNFFKIAMGEGGSAGGRFKEMDPYHPGERLSADQLQ